MYREILFPTDGSAAAEAAFEHAVGLAHAPDARIHLLYVVDTTSAGSGAAGESNVGTLRRIGESILEEFADRTADAGVEAVTHLSEGDPHREIVEYADDGIDVIVMGTRGRSGIDRYLLGSVTENVVRTARPPVFTVRDERDTG